MPRKPPAYACRACGDSFARWSGKCVSCGAMNSVAEVSAGEALTLARAGGQAQAAAALVAEEAGRPAAGAPPRPRLVSGLAELDRVLGGGLPEGAVALLGGEPGIGKSTLLAQVAAAVAATRSVLYVTAEESVEQVRGRLERLRAAAAARSAPAATPWWWWIRSSCSPSKASRASPAGWRSAAPAPPPWSRRPGAAARAGSPPPRW
jgi:DNA repair protein RadA/Sms